MNKAAVIGLFLFFMLLWAGWYFSTYPPTLPFQISEKTRIGQLMGLTMILIVYLTKRDWEE